LSKPAQQPNGDGNSFNVECDLHGDLLKTNERKGLSTLFLGIVCEHQARCVHTNTIPQTEAGTS
jgi:hypothetical protein